MASYPLSAEIFTTEPIDTAAAHRGGKDGLEHSVLFYESDEALINVLEAFASTGLRKNEAVVVIATESHRHRVDEALNLCGLDVALLRSSGKYVTLDAEQTLRKLCINGVPDPDRFNRSIEEIIDAAKVGTRVRIFSEMVAILWDDGHHPAAVQLEELWKRLHSSRSFNLLCAYPLKSSYKEPAGVLETAGSGAVNPARMEQIACKYDTTRRSALEARLGVANTLLSLSLEAGRAVAWDFDVNSNCGTWFGDLQTAFGIAANFYVWHAEDFRRRVHPDDQELVRRALDHARETRALYSAEFRLIRPDGSVCWVAAQGKFHYGPTGQPDRMMGIAMDITDRKTTADTLRRKEIELTEAQRLAGLGSWQWDSETDTVIWSEELYRIAGRDLGLPAVKYSEHPQLYTAESWKRLRHAVEKAVSLGTPYQIDLEMIRPDGTTRWVIARGEVRRDSTGRIIGLRGTVLDVTDRKVSEDAISDLGRRLIEAQEAERARIARELHDDIGQQLTLMSLTLGQMRVDAKRGIAEKVDELSRQLAGVSKSVRTLSHQLHSAELRHLGLTEALRGLCVEIAKQQHVEINFIDTNIPVTVPAEISLCLFRILQEALQNALKHSGADRIDVELLGASNLLSLTVRDSGTGFVAEEAIRGSGLGLISMQERLKLVNGSLTIDSQPGRGTTIHVRVPLNCRASNTM